jgi:hypothetical protein
MSNQSVIYLVAGACGVLAVAAYAALILVPAWTSHSRLWERLAAAFLSLYALAAFVGLGIGGGLLVVWFWDGIVG